MEKGKAPGNASVADSDDSCSASGRCPESEVLGKCQTGGMLHEAPSLVSVKKFQSPPHSDLVVSGTARDDVPSLTPVEKSKALFSGPRLFKNPPAEANDEGLDCLTVAPPSKRPKNPTTVSKNYVFPL